MVKYILKRRKNDAHLDPKGVILMLLKEGKK